ncbi:50S ribosomal protein L23 [Pseudohongiella sp. SYSU M77423]|uniref:50S ribosomal protein L23 n=1 Tax=unclassified Pseudohongiella TaxID=2629611 RepID=UPI000C9354FC|nr:MULTISPECIES: 50S ribosomal protein L23 [unclassified Pseudohongiella]MAY56909.1 50S ribosomal protein L23 [Gammaproteobacteria bacterium]MDH7944725.1 50S ribosomal protein L23 [Pseudohongiella sp. SYSU M77423]HBN13980.1 50S ribosomal protein L23 [Pseudohongiella sp.]|tara:strand:- start:1174 stop:1473 length:300 start_codon:yes stop_codon:yes gene_type:complete
MNQQRLYTIIVGPHVSEKAALIADRNNQVAFRVANDATKPEIREAIETLFKVTVEDLQVLNVKGKTKRTARGKLRQKSNWKKAYVKLAQGQEIDFAEMA